MLLGNGNPDHFVKRLCELHDASVLLKANPNALDEKFEMTLGGIVHLLACYLCTPEGIVLLVSCY